MQASYILFLLPPYYENVKKLLIKSPKIHFYDTGLACYLLRKTRNKKIVLVLNRKSNMKISKGILKKSILCTPQKFNNLKGW